MSTRAGTLLLAAGALLGIGLAAAQLVRRGPKAEAAGELGSDVVAVVDGHAIRRDDYERAVRAVAAEREAPLDRSRRRKVLKRLVDEQLLVQRGLELGLAAKDRRIRSQLSGAVISLVRARAEEQARNASDAQLRAFYKENSARFRRAPRVHIRQLFYRADDDDAAARRRARNAHRALEDGATLNSLREQADRFDIPLPDGLVPLKKIREYMGATVARRAAVLKPGETSQPVRSGSGYHVVRVVSRKKGELPPFEQIRAQVRQAHVRRAAERRLNELLERRRQQADIRIHEEIL